MNRRSPDDQSRAPDLLRGESGLIQRVRGVLRDTFPDSPPHLVLGYSGGQDSLALLLVLRELERLGACRLTVVHVDHDLRPESAADADQVVAVGRDLGVAVRVERAPEPLAALFPGRGIEDAARTFRYGALADVAREVGADAVAVAHHARDQAETVLLHLLRGAGLDGFSGMAVDGRVPVEGGTARVVRPLLREPPEEIAALVTASGLPVVEDPSNVSPAFRRNRIRHEVLPLLEEIAPGATGRLVAFADLARDDAEALEDVAGALAHAAMGEGDRLRWSAVQHAPVGLQRRVVRHWILHADYPGDLTRERVDAVIGLAARHEGGKRVQVGAGWSVRYDGGHLALASPDSAS